MHGYRRLAFTKVTIKTAQARAGPLHLLQGGSITQGADDAKTPLKKCTTQKGCELGRATLWNNQRLGLGWGTPVLSMDLTSQGETFLKVLENNKSKILWEFRQLLSDQAHTVVVKEQKREFEMDVTFKK